MRRVVLLSILLALAVPAVAVARPKANPADQLVDMPIEEPTYDPATHCTPKASRPGIVKLRQWLEANSPGVFWGSYRCEKWGRHEASLHAEDRAIDWHLDAASPADRNAARALIELFLATDAAGNAHALARRMGVEELIWDCWYWAAGMAEFRPYTPCYTKRGRLRKRIDKTTAHRDHVHIGMTKAGAAGKTSFWTRRTG